MNTDKIERFVTSFDTKNKDRELAIFLSEVIDEIDQEQKYTSQLEMELFARESAKDKFIQFVADTQKTIWHAKLMLKLLKNVNKKTENT